MKARTSLVNHVRGAMKAVGKALPKGVSTGAFGKKMRGEVAKGIGGTLEGVMEVIGKLTEQIGRYDRTIDKIGEEDYPETIRLQQVAGVGALTSLAYVLTIEDPKRFKESRAVGAYLGMRPRRNQSGKSDPQMRISKAGDEYLRRLLVGSAHYILGPFGPDCDLRRWGKKLSERGGKNGKKRAVVAVARKRSVLLHRLWVTGARYEPLRQAHRKEKEVKKTPA